jgi:hypothetical protein
VGPTPLRPRRASCRCIPATVILQATWLRSGLLGTPTHNRDDEKRLEQSIVPNFPVCAWVTRVRNRGHAGSTEVMRAF